MSGMADWNIQKRIRENNMYADNEAYAAKMQNISKTSNWHEKHQTFQVARDNMRANQIISDEMKIANRELTIRRKARLRELLEMESRMYEEELARQGLAIYKEKL